MYTESGMIPYLKSAFCYLKYLKVNVLKGRLFNIYVLIHASAGFTYKLLDYLVFGFRIIVSLLMVSIVDLSWTIWILLSSSSIRSNKFSIILIGSVLKESENFSDQTRSAVIRSPPNGRNTGRLRP